MTRNEPVRGFFVLSFNMGQQDQGVSKPVAAFDLDHTLVRPRNDRRFPNSANDWEWISPRVKPVLRDLNERGYRVVIITNQTRFTLSGSIMARIEMVCNDLQIPILVLVCKSAFRKPDAGAWCYLSAVYNVDARNSFYVGDAAGRSGDFSDSDLVFARSTGLTFFTETQFWSTYVML